MNNGKTEWLIEVAQFVRNSFGGGTFDGVTRPKLYIGAGNYSTLWPGDETNTLDKLPREVDGSIWIESLSFGTT